MEATVKYYLAEGMGFTICSARPMCPGTVGHYTFAFKPLSVPCGRVRCYDAVSSSLQKDLLEKLQSVFGNEPLKWTFNLSFKREAFAMMGKSETEFRITFDMGSALKVFLGGTARLQVQITWLKENRNNVGNSFSTQEMSVSSATLLHKENQLVFVDSTYNVEMDVQEREQTFCYKGTMNLLIIDKVRVGSQFGENRMSVFKRMLEEEIVADVIIILSNGAEVKCHRSVLAAQSDVFRTMFGTDMEEAKTRKIQMPDMSEDGVRAFLAYLYHWDLSKAEESCAVAVDMLKAGHKYNVGVLEEAMRELLLSKRESWYEVDVAVKLFLFVRNFDAEWEPLKKKAVIVVKKKNADLETSVTFKELFRDNSGAAMDFCKYSISVMSSPELNS